MDGPADHLWTPSNSGWYCAGGSIDSDVLPERPLIAFIPVNVRPRRARAAATPSVHRSRATDIEDPERLERHHGIGSRQPRPDVGGAARMPSWPTARAAARSPPGSGSPRPRVAYPARSRTPQRLHLERSWPLTRLARPRLHRRPRVLPHLQQVAVCTATHSRMPEAAVAGLCWTHDTCFPGCTVLPPGYTGPRRRTGIGQRSGSASPDATSGCRTGLDSFLDRPAQPPWPRGPAMTMASTSR